ncbi:DUF3795 domain-containing protein [candidate division TA06 bacterium]|nr:DUF3795 domain-containing protein [candidate division TA06 bacterium]
MDHKNMTAPCGIACFECIVFKASSNQAIRQQISQRIGMDLEKSSCDGCRARKGKAFLADQNKIFPEGKCCLIGENGQCRIYSCAEDHGLHNCSECGDFPCELLQPFADRANMLPQNLKVYNLCLIKKMGLKKWAEEKAGKVWSDYKTKKMDV